MWFNRHRACQLAESDGSLRLSLSGVIVTGAKDPSRSAVADGTGRVGEEIAVTTAAWTRAAGTAGLGALALPPPGLVASQGVGPVGNAAIALALFVGMVVVIQGWRSRQARRSDASRDEHTSAGRR